MSTLKEFCELTLPPKDPLVNDLIYRRDNATLVARRRDGKTTLASNLGLGLTIPTANLLGYEIPEARRVTVFYLEDDPTELQEKLRKMADGRDTGDRFYLYTKDDFYKEGIVIDIRNERFRAVVSGLCERTRPDLVVFDNLGHLIGADYNDSRRIHDFVLYLYQLNQKYDAATLTLAHPRKSFRDGRVNLVADPGQFFEETLGSSHMINSTGTLWGLQRIDDQTTHFVGGAQRYRGHQEPSILQLDDSGWFALQDNPAEHFEMVVNTEKRRGAWRSLPETFTFTEAFEASRKYLASRNSFSNFWTELQLKRLIVPDGAEGRWRKVARYVPALV